MPSRATPRKSSPASPKINHSTAPRSRGSTASEPFVIGIGASAGGLQALQSFFSAIQEPLHAAFVVVQHLSPDFKSFMVELLARHTKLTVQRAEHDAAVRAGNIYLIPPKVTLTIEHGRLKLEKTDPRRGLHLPIDQFFFSLAQDQQHRAVAIVLSGTGSDGTAGIRAIKDAGGMVIVQSEDSAQFDGMPRSAIGTGLADFVLPPEKMPAQLASYLNHPLLARGGFGKRRNGDLDGQLAEIFTLVRGHCGVDFSHYKNATVDRRIERRMSVCQIENINDYARHLAQSPREVSLLFNELLIGVTAFFRDKIAWDLLEKDVLPSLLKALPPHETFRAWVAGCSSGEEAYSLAILVDEAMQRLKMHNPVKIFATDIAKDALATAARGSYSPSEIAGVSKTRLENYFAKEASGYRVRTRLREMVVFANHNLLSDPPFTKLSLLCCRNLLIYLQSPMQQRLLTLFSFALRDEGVLFLGNSESIGEATDRFQPLATRANLYRNRRVGQPPPLLAAPRIARLKPEAGAALERAGARITAGEVPTIDEIHKRVLAEFAPACLVLDPRDEVMHVIGAAGDYLKVPPGGFTRNIFKLTSHNLANALRSALIRAQHKGDRFTYENVRYKQGRKQHSVRIHVRPLLDKHGKRTGSRLVFIEPESTAVAAAQKRGARYKNERHDTGRITELERDLSLTRETLQATVQDLETSNEEIQAANEELLAANEELQSTNEELQSVNEELHTVNTENQNRIEELTRLTNDINNLLATASIGAMLLDAQLRVRRASRSALLLLDLTEADLGIPIETVSRMLHVPDLNVMAQRVIKEGQLEEREIEHPSGNRWLLLRCTPFRNEIGRTQGVVLTLVDLTERHLAEKRLLSQAAVTQGVLDAMQANIAILDRDGRIVHKNWGEFAPNADRVALANLQIGANYFDACAKPDASPHATLCLEGMRRVVGGELPHFQHDYSARTAEGERWFRLHVVPVHSPEPGLAVAHYDITPMKHAETIIADRDRAVTAAETK